MRLAIILATATLPLACGIEEESETSAAAVEVEYCWRSSDQASERVRDVSLKEGRVESALIGYHSPCKKLKRLEERTDRLDDMTERQYDEFKNLKKKCEKNIDKLKTVRKLINDMRENHIHCTDDLKYDLVNKQEKEALSLLREIAKAAELIKHDEDKLCREVENHINPPDKPMPSPNKAYHEELLKALMGEEKYNLVKLEGTLAWELPCDAEASDVTSHPYHTQDMDTQRVLKRVIRFCEQRLSDDMGHPCGISDEGRELLRQIEAAKKKRAQKKPSSQ